MFYIYFLSVSRWVGGYWQYRRVGVIRHSLQSSCRWKGYRRMVWRSCAPPKRKKLVRRKLIREIGASMCVFCGPAQEPVTKLLVRIFHRKFGKNKKIKIVGDLGGWHHLWMCITPLLLFALKVYFGVVCDLYMYLVIFDSVQQFCSFR